MKRSITTKDIAEKLNCEARTVAMQAYAAELGTLITNVLIFSEEEAKQLTVLVQKQLAATAAAPIRKNA